jgi:hypothetical protein
LSQRSPQTFPNAVAVSGVNEVEGASPGQLRRLCFLGPRCGTHPLDPSLGIANEYEIGEMFEDRAPAQVKVIHGPHRRP